MLAYLRFLFFGLVVLLASGRPLSQPFTTPTGPAAPDSFSADPQSAARPDKDAALTATASPRAAPIAAEADPAARSNAVLPGEPAAHRPIPMPAPRAWTARAAAFATGAANANMSRRNWPPDPNATAAPRHRAPTG